MFTLNRKSLAAALAMAQTCVEPKGTIPVLAFALLEARDGKTTLTATDLDVSLITNIEGEAEDGALCVPAKQLAQLVSLLYDEIVTIAPKENSGRIQVKCGNAKHLLPSLAREHYPNIESVEGKQFPVKGDVLIAMLKRTVFAVSDQDTRYSLTGVYLETKGGKFCATATDQSRLAHIKYPVPFSESASAQIPRRTVAAILKAFTDDEAVFVKFGQDKMEFAQGLTSITTRTLLGTFPNYEMILPKKREHRFVISDLNAPVLKRAGMTAETRAANFSPSIVFEVSSAGIAVSSRHHELGETEDVIEAKCETLNGSSVKLGVPSKQILDVLAHEPEMEWAFDNNEVPFALTPTGAREYEYVYVVQPVTI